MTNEELAAAYNQLDLLVQPEGDEALEVLMTHIRELQHRQEYMLDLLTVTGTTMRLLAKEPAMDTNLWHRYLATPVAKMDDVIIESVTWQKGCTNDTRK
jgi:hypothetical protein